MNIFRNNDNVKTAKEYVDSKRNFNLFYDLNNNPQKNKITCIYIFFFVYVYTLNQVDSTA